MPQKKHTICLMPQGGQSWAGGTEYVKNFVYAIDALPQEVRATIRLCMLCSRSMHQAFFDAVRPNLDGLYFAEDVLAPETLPNRIRWKSRRLLRNDGDQRHNRFFAREGVDFVYPYYFLGTRPAPFRSAVWIYDFQHRRMPELFSEAEIRKRDAWFSLLAQRAGKVVLDCKDSENDFRRYYPAHAHKSVISLYKTKALPAWFEPDPVEVQNKYHLPDRFFLVSNQFWQHKNHLLVFKALELLRARQVKPAIVCTGHLYDFRRPEFSDEVLASLHLAGVAEQVHLMGLLPRIDQIQLMRRSLAVLQPSLFEGLNTTIEDARAIGRPMILSDFPVHVEQNPPHARYYRMHSAEDLAEALADWWETLKPGPLPEREEAARVQNDRDMQEFGKRFMDIAGCA